MSCSVCKSKQYTKRKCPNKYRVVESISKKHKGQPIKYGAPPSLSQASSSSVNLGATTLPTRTGRGGRVIREGRGSKGGRRNVGPNVPIGCGVFITYDVT